MLTLAIFTLAIMCLVTTVATAQIETPEPVVTGPADDNRPSANDTWVAYTHFPLRAFSPDVVARNLETDDRVRVNRKNTHASMGAFDPGTNVVLYQQVYRRRSSLVLYDLDTGERRPTRERLLSLIEALEPTARELVCAAELGLAAQLAERNGAMRQREFARREGVTALPRWLASRWLA